MPLLKINVMKRMIFLYVFIAALLSCSNNTNKTDVLNDSLSTNPHAVPSHTDTILHEDGLTNQSQVNSDTAAKDTVTTH